MQWLPYSIYELVFGDDCYRWVALMKLLWTSYLWWQKWLSTFEFELQLLHKEPQLLKLGNSHHSFCGCCGWELQPLWPLLVSINLTCKVIPRSSQTKLEVMVFFCTCAIGLCSNIHHKTWALPNKLCKEYLNMISYQSIWIQCSLSMVNCTILTLCSLIDI